MVSRGNSHRGSAHVDTSSLTSLLSPSRQLTRTIQSPSLFKTPLVTADFATPADVLGALDRRLYVPPGTVSAGALPRRAAQLKPSFAHLYQTQFSEPKQVAVCVRRKQRREVIFAKNKAGKGARARYRKRNLWSGTKC